MGATANVLKNAVHFLRAVGDPDGKNQERHQDGVRVQFVAEELHQTQQPHHPRHCHAHQQQGTAQAACIEIDEQPGDQYRCAKEQHDRIQAVDQVAHQLAETDNVDANLVTFQRANLRFQLLGKITVIQGLSGLRIGIEQRRDNHARPAVVRHQVANDPGTHNVAAQGRDRFVTAVVIRWHDRTAINALLRHFFPANDGHPQRFHPGAVDAWNQVQGVVDLLQRQQIVGVVDITGFVFHHDANAVAQAWQLVFIRQVILDVRAGAGNHFFEAGIDLQPCSEEAQHHSGEQAGNDDHHAMTEYDPFKPATGVFVKVLQVGNHWHPAVEFLLDHFFFLVGESCRGL